MTWGENRNDVVQQLQLIILNPIYTWTLIIEPVMTGHVIRPSGQYNPLHIRVPQAANGFEL